MTRPALIALALLLPALPASAGDFPRRMPPDALPAAAPAVDGPVRDWLAAAREVMADLIRDLKEWVAGRVAVWEARADRFGERMTAFEDWTARVWWYVRYGSLALAGMVLLTWAAWVWGKFTGG